MPSSKKVIDLDLAVAGSHRPSLKDEAFRDIERMIVTGELKPGDWVSETNLIDVSGHSRASIRSAIQRLADQGLLSIVPRRGAQICPIDYAQQFRALELRRVVEALVAKSAAKRASAEQQKKFNEIAEGYRDVQKSKNQQAMTELDSASFALMLAAADNSFAARALTSVKGLSRRFWIFHQENYGDIVAMARAHASVADAIAAGDQDEAEKSVSTLIDYVESFTLAVVGFNS